MKAEKDVLIKTLFRTCNSYKCLYIPLYPFGKLILRIYDLSVYHETQVEISMLDANENLLIKKCTWPSNKNAFLFISSWLAKTKMHTIC